MLAWVLNNISTIIICAAIIAAAVGIIASWIRNKKRGKSSCGCGCQGCAMNGMCGGSRRE
ncbi:MAG: FeoB-associated Cys-rich membrane protein [Clostridia bacterium]|nr:FeoB-associated Cys-rich membrane protein [Clostridia bacterium]